MFIAKFVRAIDVYSTAEFFLSVTQGMKRVLKRKIYTTIIECWILRWHMLNTLTYFKIVKINIIN